MRFPNVLSLGRLAIVLGLICVPASAFAQAANLVVVKVDAADPVAAGTNLSYTVVIQNAGPDPAVNVTLTDLLPAGTTFVGATQNSGPAFTCTLPAVGGTGTISCTLASMAALATADFTLTVAVPASTPEGTVIQNTVSATSDTLDPDPSNNSATQDTTVTTLVDVSVVKTGPAAADAGDTITYTVTVTNNGPSDAPTVTVIDDFPAGTTVVGSTAPPGYTCTPTGATQITCVAPSLAAGATSVFTLDVAVPPGTGGSTLTNTATVSSGSANPDPQPANNSSSVNTFISEADLSVVKTDTPDPVLAGGTVTYTVTLTNAGPTAAADVTLVDDFPAGYTVVGSTAPAGYTCTPTGATQITCTNPSVPAGASDVFTLQLEVPAGTPTGTTITNTVTVTSTTSDPAAGNNTDTETTTTSAQADLGVVKTDSADPVTAGNTVTYTVTLTNAGPHAATDVVLVDDYTAGYTVVGSTAPAGYTCTSTGATQITCTNPSVPSGASDVFTLTLQVPEGQAAGSTISNTVTVTAASQDLVAGNNTDTETTDVATSADLVIAKTSGTGPFTAGGNVDFTITVTNNGPSTATNVTVTDTLPAGSTFVSATPSQGAGCTGTGPVVCNLGTLASAGTATVTLVVQAPATSATLMNTAVVAADQTDPTPANNTATATATTDASADVAITKAAGAGPFTAGGNVDFTITVTNNGPSPATNVTVNDTLPAGSTLVSATPSQGTCTGTGPVSCNVGTLASGASATVALVVQSSPAAGAVTNNATVTATETDPTPANNAATATATTTASTDLAIAKAAGAGPFTAGGNVNYTITVTNNGPSNATAVTVTDTLPAGSTFVSATPSQGTCSGTGPVVCNVGGLLTGGTATIGLLIQAPATAGTLTNTAAVTGAETDPNAANNTASADATTTGTAPVAAIPTMSEWMLILMAITLAGVATMKFRS